MHLCDMPLVSVLIPVRNAQNWLEECLNSLLNQTFSDWECLLLNDHSHDHSGEIIRRFIQTDQRFREIIPGGTGLISANIDLLNNSHGKYVTRMDADDMMPEQRLERMVKELDAAPGKTIITGMVRFFPEEKCGTGTRFYENWLNERCLKHDHWQHIWRECVIPSPCWMARRDELMAAGGLSSLQYPEDYDMAFRLFFAGFKVISVQQVCHYWRQHEKRFSLSTHYSAEKFMELKWYYWKKHMYQKHETLVILGTGAKGKLLKKLAEKDGTDIIWLAHRDNIEGNVIDGKRIISYSNYPFTRHQKIISTLSSIDDFDDIYSFIQKSGAEVIRFC